MRFEIPEFSLVMLLGPVGAGQLPFFEKHFVPNERISPPIFAALISDAGENETAEDAYKLMLNVLELRLKHRQLACVYAPFLTAEETIAIQKMAKKYHVRLVGIAFESPFEICLATIANSPEAHIPAHIIRAQHAQMATQAPHLSDKGFRQSIRLQNADEIENLEIVRKKLRCDQRHESGPFDIIGDVHGCLDELLELLSQLGYQIAQKETPEDPFRPYEASHPENRRLIFVGDFCDRGPNTPGVYQLVMSLFSQGIALGVTGNHDDKLARKLKGRDVSLKHGLAATMEQLAHFPEVFHQEVAQFIQQLPSHLVLENGDLIVAHAGIKASMHNRSAGEIHSFCIYGDTTGQKDEFGLPIRLNWAADYNGKAMIVYGHTPLQDAEWLNNTINIDTGCVFGGKLTALRFPERTLESVPALQKWAEPARPLNWQAENQAPAIENEEAIDVALLNEDANFSSRLRYLLRLDQAAILATQAHFTQKAVHPRWLIALPIPYGSVAPAKTNGFLEHPSQAFDYYKNKGQETVVMQFFESPIRVIMVLCKDDATAYQRFGISGEGIGQLFLANGEALFENPSDTQRVMRNISHHFSKTGLWESLKSDWICLECEVRPFGKFALELEKGHAEIQQAFEMKHSFTKKHFVGNQNEATIALEKRLKDEERAILAFQEASRKHLDASGDVCFVPLLLLATEGQSHTEKNYNWHQSQCEKICAAVPSLFERVQTLEVDLFSAVDIWNANQKWLEACKGKSAGAVIRPIEFYVTTHLELLHTGLVARSPDYLRLLYGPNFDAPENLEALGRADVDWMLGVRERQFALVYEAINCFVEGKPWQLTFQAIFGAVGFGSNIREARYY